MLIPLCLLSLWGLGADTKQSMKRLESEKSFYPLSPIHDDSLIVWQESARCSGCHRTNSADILCSTPSGAWRKTFAFEVPIQHLACTGVCLLQGLCIWLLLMLSTMNYMLAWAHPGLADVMLSGIIKIFPVSLGGNVSGSGFKRFMPECLSASHCTLSLGLGMLLRFAYSISCPSGKCLTSVTQTLTHTYTLYCIRRAYYPHNLVNPKPLAPKMQLPVCITSLTGSIFP